MLSWYSGSLTEGSMISAFHLERELRQRNQVLHRNIRGIFRPAFWQDITQFHPQVIHYIPGRSAASFLSLKILSICCPKAKLVTSALFPIHPFTQRLVRFLKPDLVLTQSLETEQVFTRAGCKTTFFSSGVDTQRFIPIDQESKVDLRKKYELDVRKFTILHVGHLATERGIEILGKLSQVEGTQVILVIHPQMEAEKPLLERLKANGCIVWNKYFKNIEEIYGLSDCYLFPVPRGSFHAVEFPLSVLEAMSCNLSVVSTRFGALPRIFTEGNGLFFADSEKEFSQKLDMSKNGATEVKTRDRALPYSWEEITGRLEGIYREVMEI